MKLAFLFLLVPLMAGTGCQTIAYYSQAAKGQAQVLFGQKRISGMIKDPEVSQKLKDRLKLVLELRKFARNELKMNPKGNYLKYRNLNRKYVLWVVYAAPPLSVKLKTWWYPVAGKFTSRGFFAEADARKFAADLQEEGMDVYVGGAPAYSTLGWFNDPVLNTFIHYPDADLAELIFHELAHHHLFVSGDATFNESFATAVAQIGVARWLKTNRGTEQHDVYLARCDRRHNLSELLAVSRSNLKKLFSSNKTEQEKREGKKELIAALKKDLVALSESDPAYRKLAVWARRTINNAVLGARSVYHRRVPAFYALYEQNDQDMEAFLKEVEKIARLQKKERDSLLAEYEK
ncbi:MAG: aminopeptidase, partial [Verrucomicrobiota bacterium]|nr:aminopeptidase [Verrucomicrobiota bacterium]